MLWLCRNLSGFYGKEKKVEEKWGKSKEKS